MAKVIVDKDIKKKIIASIWEAYDGYYDHHTGVVDDEELISMGKAVSTACYIISRLDESEE